MKPGLVPDLESHMDIEVTAEMCPHFRGQLHHPVCATWTIVHYMEVAGRMLLEPFLEDTEEAVGAHISIDHRSPVPIGGQVRIFAKASGVTSSRLVTEMRAESAGRLIATGKFVQVIMQKERLEAILNQVRPQSH